MPNTFRFEVDYEIEMTESIRTMMMEMMEAEGMTEQEVVEDLMTRLGTRGVHIVGAEVVAFSHGEFYDYFAPADAEA